jgi:hypothetical protein
MHGPNSDIDLIPLNEKIILYVRRRLNTGIPRNEI